MVAKRSLIAGLSLGFVFILAQIWMLTQANILFPDNTEGFRTILIVYMVITAFVFSWDSLSNRKTERPLFSVGFFKRFPTFLIAAVISLACLWVVGKFVGGNALPSIWSGLSGIHFGVLLLHALIISFDEELIFRGFVPNELRRRRIDKASVWWTSAILFALFHFALAGGEWLLMLIYVPLGFLFMFVKEKWSPKTNMANMGVHFAWNVFILGFMSVI